MFLVGKDWRRTFDRVKKTFDCRVKELKVIELIKLIALSEKVSYPQAVCVIF